MATAKKTAAPRKRAAAKPAEKLPAIADGIAVYVEPEPRREPADGIAVYVDPDAD